MRMGIQTFLVLLMVVILQCNSSFEGYSDTRTYNSSTGTLCHVCPAGYFFKDDCTNNNTIAVCEQCPKGKYSSLPNKALSCDPCSEQCESRELVTVHNCTSTTNMTCDCPRGTVRKNHDKYHAICLPFRQCEPGSGVIRNGTAEEEPECEECKSGHTFSSDTSSTEPCYPCTMCPCDDIIIQECNTTHDRICKKKKRGVPLEIILVSVSVGVVIILTIIIHIVVCKRRDKKSKTTTTDQEMEDLDRNNAREDIHEDPHVKKEIQEEGSSSNEMFRENNKQENPWLLNYTDIFRLISNSLGQNWKMFIRILYSVSGLNRCENTIDKHTTDFQNDVVEQRYQCLVSWQQSGNIKSAKHILTALRSTEYPGILEELTQKYPLVFQDTNAMEHC